MGRIRMEAFFQNFTGPVTGFVSTSAPGVIFLPNPPSVRITTVDGITVPTNPIGFFGGTDVVVSAPGTITIELQAFQVPAGTTVLVSAKPESDGSVIGPITSPALIGTVASSATSVDITFPNAGLFFIEARATFTLP